MSALQKHILLLVVLSALTALGVTTLDHASEHRSNGYTFLLTLAGLLLLGGIYLRHSWLHAQAEHSLLQALQHAGLPLLLLNNQREVLFANSAFLALDHANQNLTELNAFAGNWRDAIERHIIQALGEAQRSTPEEILLKPGDQREAMLLRLGAAQVLDANNRPCLLISAENLSAHNQTLSAAIEREHTLRTRTQHYVQTLIDVIPQPVYVKDEAGRFVLVNQTFCARHNLTRQDLIGQARQVLDADILRAEEALQEDLRVMAGTPIFREEHLRPEGLDLYFIISKQSCEDPEGRRVLVGTQMDITPWRTAEQAVKEALERETSRSERIQAFVQRLLDVFPNPVALKDAKSRYIMINEAFAVQRGKPRAELLNIDFKQIVDNTIDEDPQAHEQALKRAKIANEEDQAVLAGKPLYKEENLVPDRFGKLHDRIVTKTACEDPDGQALVVVSMFDITEMRNAQREVHASFEAEKARSARIQAFIQRLLDVIPEPVYVKDAQARYIMINEAFAAQRKQAPEEILFKTVYELSPDVQTAERILAEDSEIIAGENVYRTDNTPDPHTGNPRWRIISKGSCLDPEGAPVIVGTNIDITKNLETEQKLAKALAAEKDLRERTQLYIQNLLDAIPLPISVRDQNRLHLQVNSKFLEESHLSREEILGKPITHFFSDPEQVQASINEDQRALAGEAVLDEKRDLGISGKDLGDRIVSKRACKDVDQNTVIVAVHINVSAQREAERQAVALLTNEQSLRQRTQNFIQRMIDVIPHPFFIKDHESRYILANEAHLHELQLSAEDVIGRSSAEIGVDPARIEWLLHEDQRVLAGEDVNEERHERPLTGGDTWQDRLVTKRLCLDVDGNPVIACSHIDVTAHRDIERTLQSSLARETINMQEFLQQVIDVLPQEFYIKDAEGRVILANPVFLRRWKIEHASEVLGKNHYQIGETFLSHRQDLQADPDALKNARESLLSRCEHVRLEDREVLQGKNIFKRLLRKKLGSDEPHILIISKAACLNPNGEQVIVCSCYDLSEIETQTPLTED